MAKRKEKPQTSHDRLFKEFLERFLPDFLRLFFPEEAARLDFSTLHFPRQELLVNVPRQLLRITDVVGEVKTFAGEPELIIVHVEIEGNDPKPLPKRMFDYYALMRILQQKPVLPLALVFAYGVGGLKWRTYQEKLWGRELVRFRYGQVGLRALDSEEYQSQNNPIAATLAVLMKRRGRSKAQVKLTALQTVVNSNLTEGDKLFLINMVETYLPQQEVFDAREEVMQALQAIEQTWMDKILEKGQQQGHQQGQQEGMRTLLLLMLSSKFGPLPQPIVDQLNAIDDTAVFANLSQQLLTATRLDEISFPAHPAMNGGAYPN
ncbi:MAG: hypothetical protein DYG89_10560 [Caldilinea sp. CFX5]|nr:hypothetical protein [Caldilinea sp. CFX5]